MHTTNLRKVGGSIMLAVPPAFLKAFDLHAGSTVGIIVEGGRLIIESKPRNRYTLDDLISQCDASQPETVEDREWIDAPMAGGELI